MRHIVCNLSVRCLVKLLGLKLGRFDMDLTNLEVGYFSKQADDRGYILVLDRKKE